MKKLFAFAAIMVCLAGSRVFAEMYAVPAGNTPQPAFMDYGGTKYSTGPINLAGGAGYSTASVTPCVFQNVFFSSGNIASFDYVQVWDATSTVNTADAVSFRFYNTNMSTQTLNGNTYAPSGNSSARYPIRMRKGLIWRPSTNVYNSIIVQFWKQED